MEEKETQQNTETQEVAPIARKDIQLNYSQLYEEFIIWFTMPHNEKREQGIESQTAFAEFHGISRKTLDRWKKRYDFLPKVKEIRQEWGRERTSNVIASIYNTSLKGNPLAQKLWMQVVEGFSEKTEVKVDTGRVISVNDIRFLINMFPEELKIKYYGYIREIIETGNRLRDDGIIHDRIVDVGGSEESVLYETDTDAQEPSYQTTNAVSESDQTSVRSDMVGGIPENNNQSTERGREEPATGNSGV